MRDGLGPWNVVIAAHRSMRWACMAGAWACHMVLHGQRLEKLGGCKRRPSVPLHPSLLDLAAAWLAGFAHLGGPDLLLQQWHGQCGFGGCCGLVCTNAVSAECGTAHV